MRILVLSYEFRPWVGGIGTYAEELAATCAAAGDETLVLAPDYSIGSRAGWKGTVDEHVKEDVSKVRRAETGVSSEPPLEVRRFVSGRSLGSVTRMWSAARELNREIDRFHPEALLLLDLHGTILFGLAQLQRGGRFRPPVLPILHGSEIYHLQKGKKARLLGRRVLDSAPHLYTNSKWTLGLLEKMGEREWHQRARVAGIGVATRFHQNADTTEAVREFRTNWSVEPDRRVLLTVARLVERKGIDQVLTCWSKLPPDLRTSWHYVVVGLGPERQALEELARSLGVEDSVTFAGAAPGAQLPAVYDSCDLYVQLSREVEGTVEGLGLTYLEAAARGKAALATWHGGIPEAIADGVSGRLVEPNDIEAATRALQELLRDDEHRATLGDQARTRVQKEFSWPEVRNRLVADL